MSTKKRHFISIFQSISVADEVTLGFGVIKPNYQVKPMPLAALSGCVLLSSHSVIPMNLPTQQFHKHSHTYEYLNIKSTSITVFKFLIS
jgi:hypothetical protein